MTEVALPPPSPRDAEVREAVLPLVEACCWGEALAILQRRVDEIRAQRRSHVEALFLEWRELSPETRPDFLTFAHHRRSPELEGGG